MRTSSLSCVEVVVRVAHLDQVEQRDTRHGSRSASRSVLFMTTNSVAVVAPTPLSHHVTAAACARASTSLSAREHAHNQQPHVIVRAGADAGAGCVVRVSGLRTASHSQGALQPSLIASTDRCARRAGCTPITRSPHAERTRPGQRRSCADEAPVRNAATCHAAFRTHDRRNHHDA